MCIRDSDGTHAVVAQAASMVGAGQEAVAQRVHPVSYTHLDVYKRQSPPRAAARAG